MKATYILAFVLAGYQMIAGEFDLFTFACGYTFFGMFFNILFDTIKESKKLEKKRAKIVTRKRKAIIK